MRPVCQMEIVKSMGVIFCIKSPFRPLQTLLTRSVHLAWTNHRATHQLCSLHLFDIGRVS
jgi:hypothetical protein